MFDVLANDSDGRTTATAGEIARRPQRAAPESVADAGILLEANHSAGNPLQAVTSAETLTFGG